MRVFEQGTRVLITGATSGIGRELAYQLGQRGCRLAITGRREEFLLASADDARDAGAAEVMTLFGSVTQIEMVQSHYRQIRERWSGLDVAILNAGVGDSSNARNFATGDYRWTFETNVFGVANWVEVILPDMLAGSHGIVAGVSSPAGWRGFPNTGSYSSSKAALSTMLESMRVDLMGTGVRVVTVCPGFVRSEMTDRNDPRDMVFVLDTPDGVSRLIRGIERGRRIVHFPRRLTWPLRYLIRPMPGWLYDRLAHRFIRRRKVPYSGPKSTESLKEEPPV